MAVISNSPSFYSFTPPAVMPAMKYLWNIANRITIGMTENTAPTIRRSNMVVHYLGPASHNHAISAGMKSDERKNPFASIFFEFSITARSIGIGIRIAQVHSV